MGEASAGALPGLAESLGWVGFELDDSGGRAVGRVEGVYVDAVAGRPVWLIVALDHQGSRRLSFGSRATKSVIAPLRECASMPGRVWIAQGREAMRDAPTVDPKRPLLREHELAICAHYGIGEGAGRYAEVTGRDAGTITAEPA